MTSIKPPNNLQTLLSNSSVNDTKNDVRWASGWTGKIHTAQFRLGVAEAKNMIEELGSYTKPQQKAVLKELHALSEKGGVGSVAVISGQAAEVFEKAAKKLGLELDFEVNRKRAPAPMG